MQVIGEYAYHAEGSDTDMETILEKVTGLLNKDYEGQP